MPTTPKLFPFCEPQYKGVMEPSREADLLEEIDAYVRTNTTDAINPITKRNMVISLTNFVIASVAKFNGGQIEHGGDIRDRDLKHEISQETIDLFWYNEAQKWPSHLK